MQAASGLKLYKFRKDIENQRLKEEERTERVKGALRYAMILVGIKAANMPDEEEKAVLVQFVLSNFGEHTAEEVKLAFDMAVAGRLEVDATAYENFSPAFFSKVMTAYRKWASQEHYQQSREIEQKQVKIGELAAGQVDWSETWLGIVESAKTHAIYKVFIPTDIYDWLVRTGQISPSNEERWEAFRLGALELRQQMEDALLSGGQPGGTPTPEIKRQLSVLNRGDLKEISTDTALKAAVTSLSKQQMVRDHAIKTLSKI